MGHAEMDTELELCYQKPKEHLGYQILEEAKTRRGGQGSGSSLETLEETWL